MFMIGIDPHKGRWPSASPRPITQRELGYR